MADTASQAKLREAREAKTEKILSGNILIETIKKRDLATYYQIIELLSPLSENPRLLLIRLSAVNGAVTKLVIRNSAFASDKDVINYFGMEADLLRELQRIDPVWCGRVAKGVELPSDIAIQISEDYLTRKNAVTVTLIDAEATIKKKELDEKVAVDSLRAIFQAMQRKYGQDFLYLVEGAYTSQELSRWCEYAIEMAEKTHALTDVKRANIYRYYFKQMKEGGRK
jgi:hypothetical protein